MRQPATRPAAPPGRPTPPVYDLAAAVRAKQQAAADRNPGRLQQLAQAGLEVGTAIEVRGRGEGTVVEHHRYMLGANEHSVDFGDIHSNIPLRSTYRFR